MYLCCLYVCINSYIKLYKMLFFKKSVLNNLLLPLYCRRMDLYLVPRNFMLKFDIEFRKK